MKTKRPILGGFTLIETLVAISIIMIGLTAAFSVAQMGISSSSFAKERITAFFLAQEALEAVRNMKDANLLEINTNPPGPNWLENMTRLGASNGPCGVPVGSETPAECDYDLSTGLAGAGTDQFLSCSDVRANNCNLKNSTYGAGANRAKYYGYYGSSGGYAGGSNSKFTRKITINEIVPDVEARVTVTVTWGSASNQKFIVTDNISSWF